MSPDKPLVSVIVITYNSETFIMETLSSILAQTYPNIELIISDDCSTDNTTTICEEWIASHQVRFAKALLIKSERNTGVSANLNRGEAQAIGRYVKPIAADDLLFPDAIENYVSYILRHPEIVYLFGKVTAFGPNAPEVSFFQKNTLTYDFFRLTAHEQYKTLMANACYIPAPSFFYDRHKKEKMHILNDESIPMLEDWPKYINITKQNIKLYLMDEVTVKYRLHIRSISNAVNPDNQPFISSKCKMWLKYQFGYNLKHHPRLAIIKYITVKQYLTKRKIWFRLESFGRWIDPLYQKIKGNPHCDWDGHYVY